MVLYYKQAVMLPGWLLGVLSNFWSGVQVLREAKWRAFGHQQNIFSWFDLVNAPP